MTAKVSFDFGLTTKSYVHIQSIGITCQRPV